MSCLNCYRLASCISRARESRTTSPTRRSGSALPFGNSAARDADPPSSTPPRWSCIAATPPRFDRISKTAPWWWWKAQPYPLCIWSHHHARPWTSAELRWHLLVLLADLHAGGICLAVLCRTLRFHTGVTQRRRCPRCAYCRHCRRRSDTCDRPDCLRNDRVCDPACCDRSAICCAGYTRWLPGRTCDVAGRRAVVDLA